MNDEPLDELELRAAPGTIDGEVGDEFPGLRLDWMIVGGRRRPSPSSIRHRLGGLSNRYRGEMVVAMRSKPIPRAYRSFYRQIGLDPDVTRIPSEQAALMRLFHGGFRSVDLVEDALLIALIETGVGVWALDADRVGESGLGIRLSKAQEPLGTSEVAHALPPGRLVVADADTIHAILFGELARGHEVGPRTRRIALFAIAVDGVPAIHVEEALWLAAEVLAVV
jgi:DNA/RNA-binding domain of Phe-tRNA-synthetase-like protein